MNEDRAARYQRLKRRADLAAIAWSIALMVGLMWSGVSVTLRHVAEISRQPAVTVLLYVPLLMLANEIGNMPLAFYSGFVLERRYGLSNQRVWHWAADQAKAFAVGAVLGCGAASVVYFLIRRFPSGWWLPGGAIFALLIVCLTNLAPIVLLPLFYTVKPLDRESLRVRLLRLAEKAGARVLGVYEWGVAAKTKKANAALAGIGSTRRILVSDTMLAEYSDEEIEVVLAHELAHHVHGDIWKGIFFESALVVAGFYLASRVLARLWPIFALRDVSDVAGLPVLVLAAGGVSLVMVPVAHAISRAFERSADRFALDLTRNPGAFMSAMRRLAAQNLAEEQPSKIVEWLFYSHPPFRQRIAAAETYSAPR